MLLLLTDISAKNKNLKPKFAKKLTLYLLSPLGVPKSVVLF